MSKPCFNSGNRFGPAFSLIVTLLFCASPFAATSKSDDALPPPKSTQPVSPEGAVTSENVTFPDLIEELPQPLNASQVIIHDVSHKLRKPANNEAPQAPAGAPAQASASASEQLSANAPASAPVHPPAGAPASPSHPDSTTRGAAQTDSSDGPAAHASGHADQPSSHATPDGVAPEAALGWLKNGNTRYIKRRFRADGKTASDRERLTKGQHPHTIVLSCSDSRVPPEIVFDQVPGELFVIRVAGEALDSSVVASIEYAVEHLGTRLIVVMGHTQCGAVSAALSTQEGQSAGSPDLDRLVGDIRPRLKVTQKDKPSANLEVESAVNADGVARDLLKRSELIRHRVENGRLSIKPALYRLDSGRVSFY